MLDTVIFDMDGLLINSEHLWYEAMDEVFHTMGFTITPELATRTTGLRTVEVVAYWQRYFGWKHRSLEDVSADIIDTVIHKILTSATTMPGAHDILESFKSRGVKTGLASSSPSRLIGPALKHFGLEPYFGVVHSAEGEAYGKPHPAVYLSCALKLKSAPHGCLAFEDSVNGMIAAKAARMRVVVVPEPHHQANPRYVLADLQLPSLAHFTEAHWQQLKAL
jgi:mannitol-1-/sugar-/sorbitol-6-/2-deoxyglucose-6-phosphatase